MNRTTTPLWMVAVWLLSLGPPTAFAAAQQTDQAALPKGASRIAGSLTDVLRGLATVLPLDIELDATVAAVTVDVDVRGLTPYQALREVLRASGVDLVLVQRGTRLLLIAGNLAEGRSSEAVAAELPEGGKAEEQPPPQTGAIPVEVEPEGKPSEQGLASANEADHVKAPGEVTADELLAIISASPRVPRDRPGLVELPFPDVDGRPISVWRPGGTPSAVALPFPDESGQPVMQQVPAGPAGFVDLPFPDEHGRQIRVPVPQAPGPVGSPTPGMVPGTKAPGESR